MSVPIPCLTVSCARARTTPQALRQSGLLVEAPKFSKFLHGMALLYPHRLRNTPHWFLPEPGSEGEGEGEAGPADDTAAGTGVVTAGGGWLARRGMRGRGGVASRLLAPKRLGALGRLPPRMSPATLDELADPWDKYEQVGTARRTAVLPYCQRQHCRSHCRSLRGVHGSLHENGWVSECRQWGHAL